MPEISPPRYAEDYSDRVLDCEFALEPAFRSIVRQALESGWSEDDISSALLQLSRAQIKSILADRQTRLDINITKRLITDAEGPRSKPVFR